MDFIILSNSIFSIFFNEVRIPYETTNQQPQRLCRISPSFILLFIKGKTMQILKKLYICWIVLCVMLWFISPIVGHNPDRVEDFFKVLGLIVLPPILFNLWFFAITGDKKYLKVFLILLCYYPSAFILFLIVDSLIRMFKWA